MPYGHKAQCSVLRVKKNWVAGCWVWDAG